MKSKPKDEWFALKSDGELLLGWGIFQTPQKDRPGWGEWVRVKVVEVKPPRGGRGLDEFAPKRKAKGKKK